MSSTMIIPILQTNLRWPFQTTFFWMNMEYIQRGRRMRYVSLFYLTLMHNFDIISTYRRRFATLACLNRYLCLRMFVTSTSMNQIN
ncbi:hypothetical protein IMY05_002G0148700 [Salix suchowensis]|nr:hypothetical protein IMY05_002G0148700 [Salix suchowensis]